MAVVGIIYVLCALEAILVVVLIAISPCLRCAGWLQQQGLNWNVS